VPASRVLRVCVFPFSFSWFEKKSRTRSRDPWTCVNVLGVLGAAAAQRPFECEGRVAVLGQKKRKSLTGAMVARLPTEQEVVGSIPTLGCGRAGRTYSDFRLLLNSAVRAVANGRFSILWNPLLFPLLFSVSAQVRSLAKPEKKLDAWRWLGSNPSRLCSAEAWPK
jgi:hypothetical protein